LQTIPILRDSCLFAVIFHCPLFASYNGVKNSIITYHTSAMEQKFSSGIFSGRPFEGTAVMVHKKMSRRISQVITDCNRLTAIKCNMENGPDVIFVS